MKRVILILILIVQFIFLIPVIFTTGFKIQQINANPNTNEENTNEENTIIGTSYDYNKYTTIKLLHQSSEQIEEVNLDEYLCHVVSAEMPADFELEALKAQAVVARTYTIYKITTNDQKHPEADICDSSTCCQAWISKEDRLAKWEESVRQENWEKIQQAVYATKGRLITYQKNPINAFFHSNSGGKTEMPINVWGGSGYPYLQSVETARRRTI